MVKRPPLVFGEENLSLEFSIMPLFALSQKLSFEPTGDLLSADKLTLS